MVLYIYIFFKGGDWLRGFVGIDRVVWVLWVWSGWNGCCGKLFEVVVGVGLVLSGLLLVFV